MVISYKITGNSYKLGGSVVPFLHSSDVMTQHTVVPVPYYGTVVPVQLYSTVLYRSVLLVPVLPVVVARTVGEINTARSMTSAPVIE